MTKAKFENIICPKCGYSNLKKNYSVYGTCTRCGKTLNEKAKFKYEMYVKLRMWRKK